MLAGIFLLIAVGFSDTQVAGPIVLDMVYNYLVEAPRVSSLNDPQCAWSRHPGFLCARTRHFGWGRP